MKRKLILCLTIIIILTSILIIILFKNLNNTKLDSPDKYQQNSEITNILNDSENDISLYEEPQYVDTNPVKIGIYINDSNSKKLVKDNYICSFEPENIMGIFYAIPTNETTLTNNSFSKMWKEYINNYPNPQTYRIGYNISFELNTGETINKTILNPDDAYYMFPKVMVFLYDDVNLVPGKKYYHITQDDMNENTICSSIKLVGDVESKNIISDITLKAFCFDSQDDFDENNNYRGDSYYTITISKK